MSWDCTWEGHPPAGCGLTDLVMFADSGFTLEFHFSGCPEYLVGQARRNMSLAVQTASCPPLIHSPGLSPLAVPLSLPTLLSSLLGRGVDPINRGLEGWRAVLVGCSGACLQLEPAHSFSSGDDPHRATHS